MLHHYLKNDNSGEHWAVSSNVEDISGQEPTVLVQLQEKTEQARVALTADQAEAMAAALMSHARTVREAESLRSVAAPVPLLPEQIASTSGVARPAAYPTRMWAALKQELFQSRVAVPVAVALSWCTGPLLNPEKGWHAWPDLGFDALAAYLVIDVIFRVRRAYHMPT